MSLMTLERSSPSPQESENEDQHSCSSYEGFVTREGCAVCLSPRPGASVGKHGESLRIVAHLKSMVKLMRPQDTLKLAVELENTSTRKVTKYMVVLTTIGVQDTEETIVLGTEQDGSRIKIALVISLWRDTVINLDGDGGFNVHTGDNHHLFKPSSVQNMWTALQHLYKATELARKHNYYVGGLSHTWMTYYQAQLCDDGVCLNEWNLREDIESFRPDSPVYYESKETPAEILEQEQFLKILVSKLRDLMLHTDLEEVTSRQLRIALEEEMEMNLRKFRGYLDEQMLRILGQMESPSQITDYLYLGSEWNASNLLELQELNIGCILNVTREIDNFYPEALKYLNIRLYDEPESDLLRHWETTYKFIKEAKENGQKVLVHCKRGVSRSASTVIAFLMKENRLSLDEAHHYVKQRRSCINPNHGFIGQLKAYEGILKARYNHVFGTQAPSRLLSHHDRSLSDTNLIKHLTPDELHHEYLSETEDGESDGCSPVAQPRSKIHSLLEMHAATTHLAPEKVPGVTSYLASLEVPHVNEEDQGIQMICTSESASNFSSPPLTPPDDDLVAALTTGHDDRQPVSSLLGLPSPHTKACRAHSLPTSLSSPPKFALSGGDEASVCKTTPSSCGESPLEATDLRPQISVLDRIKELEERNGRLSLPRPSSATSSSSAKQYIKQASTESLTSSDGSLPCQYSDPPQSPEPTRVLTPPTNVSPSSQYKHAVDKTLLLKKTDDAIPQPTSENNKGVRELAVLYGGGANKQQLKRSTSLHELQLQPRNTKSHKRSSSGQ